MDYFEERLYWSMVEYFKRRGLAGEQAHRAAERCVEETRKIAAQFDTKDSSCG